ncbi:MAG: UDP-N-acetylglucosamine dehydratase/epimerase [Chloroflexi bacterium]|nr:UDP-N-acetylglucosamine dehydratase/epimerase [Chloroflexota bacterium]
MIPLFLQQRQNGKITITDRRMTRFWLTLDLGVRFVIRCTEQMRGGEVFVPKIPSTRIADLARVIAPQAEVEVIGIRPGEKLHEVLIHEDEARTTVELDDMFVVMPTAELWFGHEWQQLGKSLPDGYRYTSETNQQWLNDEDIHSIVAPLEIV